MCPFILVLIVFFVMQKDGPLQCPLTYIVAAHPYHLFQESTCTTKVTNFATMNHNSKAERDTTHTTTITEHVIYITINLATIHRPKGYIFIITMCVTKAAEPP